MNPRRGGAALAGTLAAIAPAQAHTVIEGVSGFPGGLLHPLLVPAHVLLLLTLGLLAGQQKPAWRRILALLFAVSLAGTVVLIASAVAFESQTFVLLICAITGALLALAWPLPPAVPAVLIVAGAAALMLESVPALTSVSGTLLALAGTACGAAALFSLATAASARATRPWQAIGRRIVGSWATASALLVLALRFVK